MQIIRWCRNSSSVRYFPIAGRTINDHSFVHHIVQRISIRNPLENLEQMKSRCSSEDNIVPHLRNCSYGKVCTLLKLKNIFYINCTFLKPFVNLISFGRILTKIWKSKCEKEHSYFTSRTWRRPLLLA